MRIHCATQDIRALCTVAEKISGKQTTLPILGTLLFTAEKGRFKVTSTNLEMGFEGWVPARVEGEGRVAIPARTVTGFLAAVPAEQLTLETEGEHLRVRSEKLSTLVRGQSADEFPRLPSLKKKTNHTLPATLLRDGLLSVLFASAPSDIKPEIASVYIVSGASTPLTFVATDSFRLAYREFPGVRGGTFSLLLPLRAATELARVLEQTVGDVEIALDENQALFQHRTFNFISRLVDGVFPDYQQIVPKHFTTEAVLSRAALQNTLRNAGFFTGRLQAVTVRFNADERLVEVQTGAAEIGEHNETLPTTALDGRNVALAFNYRYLVDGVAHLASDEVRVGLNGEGRPMRIRANNDPSYFYIIMPMKNI